MYKVIGTPKSRAARIIWLLEELELVYEIEPSVPHDDLIKSHNPSGKIPVLIEPDGHVLLDSIAICQYLTDKFERFTHKPGSRQRALQDSFIQFAADDLETPLWTAAKHSFVLPKDKRVKEVKPTCNWEFSQSMKALETRLGEELYLTGEMFTIADLLITNCILWGALAKFDPPGEKLAAYVKRVSARPGHQRAIEKGSF